MRRRPSIPLDPMASGEVPIVHGSTYVYLVYGEEDRLLYVGVTDQVLGRFKGHQSARWWPLARRVAWEQYRDRGVAERVERRYIRDYVPRFNIQGNVSFDDVEAMGHQRHYTEREWGRLGERIREAREALRYTQRSLAGAAGIDVDVERDLERGNRVEYKRLVLDGVELALGWRPGSVEAVLAGGSPSPMSAEELRERAVASARRLASAERL